MSGGDLGCSVASSNPDWAALGPRFGFAYRLTSDGQNESARRRRLLLHAHADKQLQRLRRYGAVRGGIHSERCGLRGPVRQQGPANPFPANYGLHVPGPDFVFAPANVIASYFPPDFHIPRLFTWSMRLEAK